VFNICVLKSEKYENLTLFNNENLLNIWYIKNHYKNRDQNNPLELRVYGINYSLSKEKNI